MNGLKAKLNWGKIKDFLFKNKKRKIIVACTFALAVVLLLCAILIPVLSNMNKKFEMNKRQNKTKIPNVSTWENSIL